jgi:23S rRNA pseudouridine2605 synthase
VERLHKIIARSGWASRREAERWIVQGRVKVNGVTVRQLGSQADPRRDRIEIDGRPVQTKVEHRYLLFYKPTGLISSMRDPEGRPDLSTWPGLLRKGERLFPVGRLDFNSQGLLLLTNHGELAFRLTHPKYEISKTYHAKVSGVPSEGDLERIRKGVRLEDGVSSPAGARILETLARKAWVEVRINEGRYREVRRIFDALGYPVDKLIRTELGPLRLGSLRPGEIRPLSQKEVAELKQAAGLWSHRAKRPQKERKKRRPVKRVFPEKKP